jgi:hypothetical protein
VEEEARELAEDVAWLGLGMEPIGREPGVSDLTYCQNIFLDSGITYRNEGCRCVFLAC